MNITPHAPSLSVPTAVNQPTENLRRENVQRDVITQVSATSHSGAEKGVASDKDRARTPAQTNEQVDFSNLRKHAEHADTSISEHNGDHDSDQRQHQEETKQDSSQNNSQSDNETKQDQAVVAAEQKIINQLKTRDQEVRQHELAHASIGGSATGAPSYSFEVGPDGKKYATSGEVSVDLSSVPNDPQATITKMQKIHAAALAPANPSTQDTRVAASASRIILQAQSEILSQKIESTDNINRSQNSSTNTRTTFKEEQPDDFDTFINQTLASQDVIAPSNNSSGQTATTRNDTTLENKTQSTEVKLRSQRIESFYSNITQAYEKPDNFQFELTA